MTKASTRALVLSGGGARGAYQAGVLYHLGESGDPGFDLICGTSVGAVNGVGLAHFPKEEFDRAARWVSKLWFSEINSSDDVYRWKWFKYIRLAFSLSMAHTKPLQELLNRVVDPAQVLKSGVELMMPAVDLRTKDVHVFDEKTPDLVAAVRASASYPGVFEPVEYLMSTYTDGGVRDVAPVSLAADYGAEDILVIHTYRRKEEESELPKNGIELAIQLIETMSAEILRGDISYRFLKNRQLKDKDGWNTTPSLNVISPSSELGDPLDFSAHLTKMRFELGYEDARMFFGDD